jgi:ADP-heptose:LPS heptosyltransferase
MYDIVFLIGGGIGNTIEALYAVEYCLNVGSLKIGLHISGVPDSFREYLRQCYPDIVIDHIEGIATRRLIQAFTVSSLSGIRFEEYFYVMADARSSRYQSETELYLSVVRGLYPSGDSKTTLTRLVSSRTLPVEGLENKIVLCPGCSPERGAKRWPHYEALIHILGESQVVVIGSKQDQDFRRSYTYPPAIPRIVPQLLLNKKRFWEALRKVRVLSSYGHHGLASKPYAYFDRLSWPEIAHVLKMSRAIVGNDTGLTHVAAALGARGITLFGPSSKEKNKSMNAQMMPYARNLACQPCQFAVGGIPMGEKHISCPFSVKCLADISAREVLEFLGMQFGIETTVLKGS